MSRYKEDLDTWKRWNDTGDGKELEGLLNSMDPLIQKAVNKYQAAPIPRSAIEMEGKKQAIEAFKTYNPSKAQLNTHVGNRLQKLSRFVANHQNVARIPEHRVQKIQTYKNVYESLFQDKDREPTLNELSDELMWGQNEVIRMQNELRKDLSGSESFDYAQAHDFDRTSETINFAYYSFSGNQQLIYDYLTGSNGKPQMTIDEAAKKLKMDKGELVKARDVIVSVIKRHSGGTM